MRFYYGIYFVFQNTLRYWIDFKKCNNETIDIFFWKMLLPIYK